MKGRLDYLVFSFLLIYIILFIQESSKLFSIFKVCEFWHIVDSDLGSEILWKKNTLSGSLFFRGSDFCVSCGYKNLSNNHDNSDDFSSAAATEKLRQPRSTKPIFHPNRSSRSSLKTVPYLKYFIQNPKIQIFKKHWSFSTE